MRKCAKRKRPTPSSSPSKPVVRPSSPSTSTNTPTPAAGVHGSPLPRLLLLPSLQPVQSGNAYKASTLPSSKPAPVQTSSISGRACNRMKSAKFPLMTITSPRFYYYSLGCPYEYPYELLLNLVSYPNYSSSPPWAFGWRCAQYPFAHRTICPRVVVCITSVP